MMVQTEQAAAMSVHSLPYLYDTAPQARADRLGWTAGHSFTAYGLRFGLRVNDPSVLATARAAAPLSWQATSAGEVDILYSLLEPQKG
jgi:hypothetical protein